MATGWAPYEEAATRASARMSLLQRLGYGIAGAAGTLGGDSSVSPLQGLASGFAGGFGQVNAARQAAENYAQKKMEAQRAQQDAEINRAYKMALTKQAERAPVERAEPVDSKNRDYKNLISQGLTPVQARQVVYGATLEETAKQKKDESAADQYVPNANEDTLNSLADALAAGMPFPIRTTRKEGVDLYLRAIQRAKQRHPDMDLAKVTADYRAMSGALSTLQRGVSGSEGFAETAKSAMGVLDSTIESLPDTGIVPLNFLLRTAGRAMGNEDITAFDNARQVVNTELGRILGQGFLSNGTQLTDSMRHEIREGMSPNATKGQLRAALRVLRTDLGFKIQAGQGQLNKIRGQIGGRGAPADSSDPFTGLYK